MGRVEVEGVNLQAHAVNEGITDTMLEGSIRFESNADGIAVVLDLKTIGKKTPMTDALRDLVMRTLRSKSLVVVHDGEEIRCEANDNSLLRNGFRPRKLPALKRLPLGGPKLMEGAKS